MVIGGHVAVIASCPSCGTHFKHHLAVSAHARCGRCEARIDLSRLRAYRVVPTVPARPDEIAMAARHMPIGLDEPSLAGKIARRVRKHIAGARVDPAADAGTVKGAPSTAGAAETNFEMRPSPPRPAAGTPSSTPAPSMPPARDVMVLPNVESPWNMDDPLPPIPEMSGRAAYEPSVPPVSEADVRGEGDEGERAAMDAHAGSRSGEGRGTTFLLWLAAGAIAGTGASWTLGGTTIVGIAAGSVAGALIGWGWMRWASPR